MLDKEELVARAKLKAEREKEKPSPQSGNFEHYVFIVSCPSR
jgi:hypothetical protein